MTFLVLDLEKLITRNENCNILVFECLGCVEPRKIVIVTSKPITKLGLGLGIMPK